MMTALRGVDFVPRLLDYLVTPTNWIMVMEKPKNFMDLLDYLNYLNKPLDEQQAKKIARNILSIVDRLAGLGVYHLDIKEDNFLINPQSMEVFIIDFGSSKFASGKPHYVYQGAVVYCCPEFLLTGQFHSEMLTAWQLGVLLYGLVHHELPFDDRSSIINHTQKVSECLSSELRSLIDECLSKCPSERIKLNNIVSHPWLCV